MNRNRLLLHSVFLCALPLLVAALGLSVWSAAGLVLLALVWRWAISLATFVVPAQTPAVVLDTISASHFVEKVRWNMDAAGIDYVERPSGGTLGAYFGGRTVPRLRIRTGAVESQIGNSAEILRFVWGHFGDDLGEDAAHLEPTRERRDLEKRLDRHGVNLQTWIYYHVLPDRELTCHIWGADNPAVSRLQRLAVRALYPLLAVLIRKSFRITRRNYEKATQRIEELLGDIDLKLADGRSSILAGDRRNYTDYQFAAMCGLWLVPENYAAGKAQLERYAADRMPESMAADVNRWREDFPRVVQWVENLYATERMPPQSGERG